MKLLLYIDTMQLGGAQRVMANLADCFLQQGYDIILVNDIYPVEGKKEYLLPEGIKREYIDAGSRKGWKKNRFRVMALRKLLKQEKPDIALSFLGPPNERMLVAGWGLKIKKIVSVRNDPYQEYGSGVKKTVARMLFRLADGCVFQTPDAAAYFPKAVRKKAKIIFNPVNEVFYQTERSDPQKEIVMVGRLQPQKNPQSAVAAFAAVAPKYPDYKLVFYGEGELQSELEALAEQKGLSGRVEFRGHTQEVNQKLAQAGVYMMTSDYEGMPNALMEAMAIGLPVISTDCPCGGPKILIRTPEEGWLVPCGRPDALAEALDTVLRDPENAEKVGKAAALRAEEFRAGNVFAEWKNYLESVSE